MKVQSVLCSGGQQEQPAQISEQACCAEEERIKQSKEETGAVVFLVFQWGSQQWIRKWGGKVFDWKTQKTKKERRRLEENSKTKTLASKGFKEPISH